MAPQNIDEMNIKELGHAIQTRLISCCDVAEFVIKKVLALNPQLNAIVRFDPDYVRAQALALDARHDAGFNSPWLGIPVTFKDNIWIEGRPTSSGSLLYKDFIAPHDAIAVSKLRQAGALIVGSTNCSEFACKGFTLSPLHGETCNPWDMSCTPGGSSGGAASATAAGLCHLALGTDAGGSVRRPASHTGLIGLKPTSGMIPHAGGFDEPIYGHSAIGILTRSTHDAFSSLSLLAQHDPADVQSPPLRPTLCSPIDPLPHSRIAWSPQLGLGFPVEPEVNDACEAALEAFRSAGHEVVMADPPWPQNASEETLMPLQLAGLAAIYGDAYQKGQWQPDPDIKAQIEAGLGLSGRAVAEALELRKSLYSSLAGFFKDYDFLVCPTTPVTAWPLHKSGPEKINGQKVAARAHAVFTPIFNHCNVPACSVPCGLDHVGLPIGLQIVGPMFSDDKILALAAKVEEHTDYDFSRIKLEAYHAGS